MKAKRNKNICPTCQNRLNDATDLKKCKSCYMLSCPKCYFNGLCIDCHTKQKYKDEKNIYFNEKYGVNI